jgi:two-component system sensor histidine kinase VicK
MFVSIVTLQAFSLLIVLFLGKINIAQIIAASAAVFVSIGISVLLSKLITQPMNELDSMIEHAMGDESDDRLELRSFDEINKLAYDLDLLCHKYFEIVAENDYGNKKLQTLLEYVTDGVIAIDQEGRFIHANSAAMNLLGLKEYDIAYHRYDDVIEHFSEELRLADLYRAISTSTGLYVEDSFNYAGATYLIRFGEFTSEAHSGIIIVIQDVTERQRLDDMQNDFVGNVSHELKTPITTIKSYVETLIDGGDELDQEMKDEFIEIIESEVDRMSRLVRDLLQLTRLDYKQQKWYKSKADIVQLIKVCVKKMEYNVKAKDQVLNMLYVGESPIFIDMDSDQIERVLQNLLSNAFKYTPEHGRIDIDLVEYEDAVEIIVSDNGIGIPEADIPRVFERFFRVDKARSRELGGTGLGLSITKQIIEEHNGTIEIKSSLGSGTRVMILLPKPRLRGKHCIN